MTRRSGSVRGEIIVNIGFSVLRAVFLLWLMRLAGQVFAPAVLGLFLLARRHTTTAAAFLSMGATQTIQRYMSLHLDDLFRRRIYFLLPVGLLWLAALAVLPLAWVFRMPLALILFGAAGQGALAFAVILYALMSIYAMLAISTLMALRRVYAYNAMNLAVAGPLPMAGLYAVIGSPTPEVAILITALLLGLVSGLATLIILRDLGWQRVPAENIRRALLDFRNFGLPRTLSAGFDAATLTIGGWWLRDMPEAASFLLIALTLFRLSAMILMPASQVLGLASVRAATEPAAAAAISRRTIVFALWAGCLAPALLQPWLGPVLLLWLGQADLAAGTLEAGRVLIWGLPFAIQFYCLRGIIELRWTRPLNLLTQIVSLAGFLVLVSVLPDLPGSVVAANAAMLVLGGLMSLWWLRRDLPGRHQLAPVHLVLITAGLFLSQHLAAGLGGWSGMALGAAGLAVFGVLGLYQLRRILRR